MTERFIEIGPSSTKIEITGTNIGPNGTESRGIEIVNMDPRGMGPGGFDVIGIGTYLAIIVGIANICLLIALIYVYMKNYRQLKSQFTMGLLVFASLLLLQNVVSTSVLVLNIILGMGYHGFGIDRPQASLSSINIIQLIALSVLLKITWD